MNIISLKKWGEGPVRKSTNLDLTGLPRTHMKERSSS